MPIVFSQLHKWINLGHSHMREKKNKSNAEKTQLSWLLNPKCYSYLKASKRGPFFRDRRTDDGRESGNEHIKSRSEVSCDMLIRWTGSFTYLETWPIWEVHPCGALHHQRKRQTCWQRGKLELLSLS